MTVTYFYRGHKIAKVVGETQDNTWNVHFPFHSEGDETEYTDYYVSFLNLQHARKYIDEQFLGNPTGIYVEHWPEPVENF